MLFWQGSPMLQRWNGAQNFSQGKAGVEATFQLGMTLAQAEAHYKLSSKVAH